MIDVATARKTYRVAVVGGAGTWGRHYMRAYAEHPQCRIMGLVDRARKRRQQFADHYGAEAVYDQIEDLLAKQVPDIVSVVLPVDVSLDVVVTCAQAGVKAVSCEKPVAVSLEQADEAIRICRELGTSLGCAVSYWAMPYLIECAQWVQAGNIGRLTSAAIPAGLSHEVSGKCCVALVYLRLLTGMEVEWVEGWTLGPDPSWTFPSGASESEMDGPAYGRLGLSGGIVCDVPKPDSDAKHNGLVVLHGENGQVRLRSPRPVLMQGTGASSRRAQPAFFNKPWKDDRWAGAIGRLIDAVENGGEAICSAADFRQALEIAIALKRSCARGHERVHLPLEDRSLRLFPCPHRLSGGDIVGWKACGYEGPPALVG